MTKRIDKNIHLNCIIPEAWMAEAMAEHFKSTSKGEAVEELREGSTIRITRSGGKPYESFRHAMRDYGRRLGDHRHVWIHLKPGKHEQEQLEYICKSMSVPFSGARIEAPDSRGMRVRLFRAGVVVSIQHACAVFLRYRPEILDDKRSLIYDRDEGRYE